MSGGRKYASYLRRVRTRGFLEDEEVTPEEVDKWLRDPTRFAEIMQAREVFRATLPEPFEPLPDPPEEPLPKHDDPATILFKSKILPAFEAGGFYAEAHLAAGNLTGWADAIARRARTNCKAFFVELAKALKAKKHLYDETDDRIARNYYTSQEFNKPLCQLTEEEGSNLLRLSVAAYDKRLLRLGIKKKRGRPKKTDKTSR